MGKLFGKLRLLKTHMIPLGLVKPSLCMYIFYDLAHFISTLISCCCFYSLVKINSKCLLRLYSHSTFKRDLILGEGRIDIQKQLVREQGKFDKTNLVLDVKVSLQLKTLFNLIILINIFLFTGRNKEC